MSNIEAVSMTSQPKPPTLSLDHLARAATITHRWDQMSLGTLVLSYALYVSSTHPKGAMITTLPISHGRKLTSFHDDALPQPRPPTSRQCFLPPIHLLLILHAPTHGIPSTTSASVWCFVAGASKSRHRQPSTEAPHHHTLWPHS